MIPLVLSLLISQTRADVAYVRVAGDWALREAAVRTELARR